MIERRTQPCQQEGRIEARRHRAHNPKTRRRLCEERDQRHRVVLWGEHCMLERGLERVAVGIRYHARVLEDHIVEAGTFEGTRHIHVEAPSPIWAVVVGPRLVPRRHGEVHEPTQVKALWLYHLSLLLTKIVLSASCQP